MESSDDSDDDADDDIQASPPKLKVGSGPTVTGTWHDVSSMIRMSHDANLCPQRCRCSSAAAHIPN